ncbi:hypothetical protein [Micromonospora sp. CA-248212]|uniref:hypothetical protein n=1 Tax=Micromonospora sp. CA-248212 TaxID=3239961 RepID=UPI003D943E23
MLSERQEALPLVLELPDAPEDDGAEAQANFRFQCEVIARWSYGLFEPDGPIAVVCEHHEDFMVLFADGQVDLASVKHRSRNRGTWSVADLCDDGGLTHLFDRWVAVAASGRPIRALHLTNAGLTNGPGQSAELAGICEATQPDAALLLAWSKKLARQFLMVSQRKRTSAMPTGQPPARPEHLLDTDPLVQLVARFIPMLTFVPVSHRDDIAASTIIEVALPLCRAKGWDTHDGQHIHDAVMTIVEKTVRTFGKRRLDLARQVVGMAVWPNGMERDERLAARLLDAKALDTAIIYGGDVPLFPPQDAPLPAPGGSQLRRKMADGQLSASAVHLAERLRSAWYSTHRSRLPDLPGDAGVLAQIEAEVLELVLDAQDAALAAGTTPYGRTFFRQLRDTVRVSSFRQRPPLRINDQHALGVSFELSDQCIFDFLPPTSSDTQQEQVHD